MNPARTDTRPPRRLSIRAPPWPWSRGESPRGADASPTPPPFALRRRPEHRGHRPDDLQRL